MCVKLLPKPRIRILSDHDHATIIVGRGLDDFRHEIGSLVQQRQVDFDLGHIRCAEPGFFVLELRLEFAASLLEPGILLPGLLLLEPFFRPRVFRARRTAGVVVRAAQRR